MKSPAELAALFPALLDALRYVGTGVVVMADRSRGLELWYANEPAATMVGYTLEELAQRDPLEPMIVDEDRGMVLQLSAAFRAGQPMPAAIELGMRRKDGTTLHVEHTFSAAPIEGGFAYLSVMREVYANPASQLTLLEADRIGLVGALSAGFAHEINNPLTSVLLNLRSLRKQLVAHLPEAAQRNALRALDDVTTGAERIATNVRALQTLATRSETQSIDLAAVVSASLRLATPTLEPNAHVIRQIFPVRPVRGEESRLGQAVLAMLLFAGSGFEPQSSATSNRIVVAVEERDGCIVVEVSDNGRELTPEEARRAFDPFFRSTARGAGVGVGLGVARSVASTLGGEVSLAGRPGGGAVVTMRLPPTTA